MRDRHVYNHQHFCSKSRYRFTPGLEMIDMWISCAAAPKGSENKSNVCISPIILTLPLIDTPWGAIYSHHLSGEHSIQPRGQISQQRRHGITLRYLSGKYKGFEEPLGFLQASAPKRIDKDLFWVDGGTSTNLTHIFISEVKAFSSFLKIFNNFFFIFFYCQQI